MANPADGLKEVAKELKEKFDEAGMGSVDEFVDKLEDIKAKAKDGPKEILDKIEGAFKGLKDKMQECIDNPSSLAPEGGGMAACASWYGNSVAGKLKDMADQSNQQVENLKKLAEQIMAPMKQLGDVLENAMKELEGSLNKLAKLPKEVGKLAAEIDSPDDIAKIDVAPMKKCLDVSGIQSPLDSIKKLKDVLSSIVDVAKRGFQELADFVGSCPDMVQKAFDVPVPFCFLTSMLLSQAPPAMKSIMDMVEEAKKVDTQSLMDLLDKVADSVVNMDIDAVTTPVNKFAESAKDPINKLETTVSGAKAAGGMGAAAGAVGKLFGK